MNKLFAALQFIRYQWSAKTKYYIHSPFVYQFFLNVLEPRGDNYNFENILVLRKSLSNSNANIHIQDFGSGKSRTEFISTLEKNVAISHKYGQVLSRLTNYFKPKNILEFGTSIGISSAYIASGMPQSTITTIEGAKEIADFARKNFNQLGLKNIKIICSPFDDVLPELLTQKRFEMIFFDGNHTKEATLRYFEACVKYVSPESIFVFDDIYWSREMSEAWEEIKAHPKITLTIDIYRIGFVFFKKEKLKKEHFVLRY
jgi:predicted O-methyltransferase YrrM